MTFDEINFLIQGAYEKFLLIKLDIYAVNNDAI